LGMMPAMSARERYGSRSWALIGIIALASGLIAVPWSRAESPGTSVRIVVEPLRISVESRGLSVPDVLRALGRRMGFSVVGGDAAEVVKEISVQGSSVEDLARRLLRNENHVVVYRQGATVLEIDEIILSGPGGASVGHMYPQPAQGERLGPGAGTAIQPRGRTDDSQAPFQSEAAAEAMEASRSGEVHELLRSHAGPFVQQRLMGDGTPGGTGPGLSPARARDSRPVAISNSGDASDADALAAATQKAQSDLRALLEALETATRSLGEPGFTSPR
jgi:hypothetical protein